LFNLHAITKFTDSQGIPLLGKYSKEDLETFLKTKTTEHKENELPELLVIHNLVGEQLFIKKTAILPFCCQLLVNARALVKNEISARWFKLLKVYAREPAMDKDEEFEKLLARMTRNTDPTLVLLLKDNKLALTYYEVKEEAKLSESTRLFDTNGKLLPFSGLLMLSRKALLADAQMLLPFWYSIRLLVCIIRFFKRLGKPKYSESDDIEESPIMDFSLNTNTNTNVSLPIKELAVEFIPPGSTLVDTLAEQESRWNTRLNPQARQDLTADVNAFITDRMRQIMRLPKKPRITRNFLEQTALAFVSEAEVVRQLGDREAFTLYVKLYIINLLLNKKI
jgi:hypothetical protein